MDQNEKRFLVESEKKVFDPEHRKKMNFALRQADTAYKKARQQFADLDAAKQMARSVKREAIEHLDRYLIEFERRFVENGGKVIWAENTDQALQAIIGICQKNRIDRIVKSKSIVTEEIHLNQFLEDNNVEVLETDLGEYIQQLANEAPYHIVSPSIHKSRHDVAELFHQKLKVEPNLSPEQLTLVARNLLRKKFREAGAGITGANFLIADIGGIAITENEGNAWLSASAPKIHIAITGIEKLIPSIRDLELFWPLLATHGSGQQITVYNSIYTGPKKENEIDGPQEMYVILLDNSRTKILGDPTMRESLYCIRCGACLNVCPVYKNVGGHVYDTTYSGPIGSIISPYMQGKEAFKHLSYASSLCGACTEVCPVGIRLHDLLLYNRRASVAGAMTAPLEKSAWSIWKSITLKRFAFNAFGSRGKNFMLRKFFTKSWGGKRSLPRFAKKSFNRLWN